MEKVYRAHKCVCNSKPGRPLPKKVAFTKCFNAFVKSRTLKEFSCRFLTPLLDACLMTLLHLPLYVILLIAEFGWLASCRAFASVHMIRLRPG